MGGLQLKYTKNVYVRTKMLRVLYGTCLFTCQSKQQAFGREGFKSGEWYGGGPTPLQCQHGSNPVLKNCLQLWFQTIEQLAVVLTS